ncbi:MAG: ribosome hibernation-promoting factor, HPF/YfiA family [Actinomycetes bacterium]
MDIVVKGRHTEISERFREHVIDKLAKIEKLDSKVISIDVECSKERNPRLADQCERIELTIYSRGPVVRAEASAQDCYGALDLAVGRLEARLRKAHDRRKVHHGMKSPVSVRAATADLEPGTLPATSVNGSMPSGGSDTTGAGVNGTSSGISPAVGAASGTTAGAVSVDGEGPMVIREKLHSAEPMDLDQALYEMELVGHDFYLFVDAATAQPSVVYRRVAYDYGVIRLAV